MKIADEGRAWFAREFEKVAYAWLTVDWSSSAFDVRKAAVLSVFAGAAYQRIPEFELPGADRVKLFMPSWLHEALLSDGGGAGIQVGTTWGSEQVDLRFEVVFTMETPVGVAVGFRHGEVLIVGIRGTDTWNDFLTDLHADHEPLVIAPHDGGLFAVLVHLGFLDELLAFARLLQEKIDRLREQWKVRSIHLAGHSLGGALAAMLHGMDGATVSPRSRDPIALKLGTSDGYTFGCPRYADAAGMRHFRPLHHVRIRQDFIPRLPPRLLGYARLRHALELRGRPIEAGPTDSLGWARRYLPPPSSFNVFKYHACEYYIHELGHLAREITDGRYGTNPFVTSRPMQVRRIVLKTRPPDEPGPP